MGDCLIKKISFKVFLFIFTLIAFSAQGSMLVGPSVSGDDQEKIEASIEECLNVKNYIIKNQFPTDCQASYLHFSTDQTITKKGLKNSDLVIANYNLLHPGTSKTLYKDNELVAKMMNEFDLISVQEVLSTIGRDKVVNDQILEFIQNAPAMILETKEKIKVTTSTRDLMLLKEKLAQLQKDIVEAPKLYRSPGYLKILVELKKLDSSWSLILSPRGDSALDGSVEEYSGFYYRANKVMLVENPYCRDYERSKGITPVACLVKLQANFMGKDFSSYFSRRPFLATFKSATKIYSLLTSHVVYNYSGSDEEKADLLNNIFNVENVNEIGAGVDEVNFARFAEIKVIVDFMKRYKKKYSANNLIYSADTNLNYELDYWNTLVKELPDYVLKIKDPTSLSTLKTNSKNEETEGKANSYDHFLMNDVEFKNCDEGKVYYYQNEAIGKLFDKKYSMWKSFPFSDSVTKGNEGLERDFDGDTDSETTKLDFPLSDAAKLKMDQFLTKFKKELESFKVVKKGKIENDDFEIQSRTDRLKRRVFLNQLTIAQYYRGYLEVFSDHYPIIMKCKN